MKKIYSILCLFIAVSAMVSCSSDDKIVVSSLNSIISFEIDFEGLTADDVNYDLGNDITISVPFGTNLVALISTIEVDAKATITPASGEALDFTDGEAIEFTVTAEDAVTTKMYNVTINVRGEVGSGTKLKTYTFTEDFGFINIVTSTTLTYNETSNFVTTISTKEEEEEDAFVETLIYDAKNQVIEKTAEGENTVYSYNAEGQITQAVFMRGEVKKYTYDYTYDSNGSLATEIRIDHEESDVNRNKYNQAYTVKDGNLIKIVKVLILLLSQLMILKTIRLKGFIQLLMRISTYLN